MIGVKPVVSQGLTGITDRAQSGSSQQHDMPELSKKTAEPNLSASGSTLCTWSTAAKTHFLTLASFTGKCPLRCLQTVVPRRVLLTLRLRPFSSALKDFRSPCEMRVNQARQKCWCPKVFWLNPLQSVPVSLSSAAAWVSM
jgi:hypothetical protein